MQPAVSGPAPGRFTWRSTASRHARSTDVRPTSSTMKSSLGAVISPPSEASGSTSSWRASKLGIGTMGVLGVFGGIGLVPPPSPCSASSSKMVEAVLLYTLLIKRSLSPLLSMLLYALKVLANCTCSVASFRRTCACNMVAASSSGVYGMSASDSIRRKSARSGAVGPKYRTPSKAPSCLPAEALRNSTPTKEPVANFTSPTKRTTATLPWQST
mmetsp:Transcript_10013/g.24987  ORF Transcript_10013/g.24987 Transcript_10013/m.24987 type:complete len:214 (+) Transcript_10013:2330-2971(+)